MAGRSGVVRELGRRGVLRVPLGLGLRIFALFVLIQTLFLLALSLASRPAAAEPVKGEASAIVENGFARLSFKLAAEVEAQVRVSNSIIIITFKRPVDINVDKLGAGAADYIAAARRDPDGTAIRIALARKVTVKSMAAAERLFVDLLPDGWVGLPPGLPREVIEELARRAREAEKKVKQQRAFATQNKMPAIRVRVSQQPTFARYTFDLPDVIGVASSDDTDKLTLTFNALLKFDLADAKAALPAAVGSIESELDHDTVVVRFAFIGKVDVRTFREDLSYVVDVTPVDTKNSRQDVTVRSDELAALAAEGRKPQPPAGVDPPQTVPAHVPPNAGADPPPAEAQIAPEKVTRNDPAAVQDPRAPPKAAAPPPAQPAQPASTPAAQAAPAQRPPVKPPALASAEAKPAAAAAQSAPKPQTPPAKITQPAPVLPVPAPVPERANAPRNASIAVEVTLKRQGDNLSLLFPFARPTPAAVFRRADTLWLVFDTDAAIGLASLEGEPSHTIKGATLTRLDHLSVLRIKLARPRLISAATDGPGWIVTVGSEVLEATRPLAISRNVLGTARASITIPFDDPRQLHRLEDPDAGDTLMVVTALGPARAFVKGQDFVEFRALAATHGVVVQPIADDLDAELAVDKIVITRPAGLTLSGAIDGGSRTRSVVYQPFVLDAHIWSLDRKANFSERRSELIRNAAGSKDLKRLVARVELARFYLARAMPFEAKGVLDVALADNPVTAEDPTPLVLRGVANILSGRPVQGLKDLANPFVGDQHDAPLWRALARAREGKWSDAREGFRNAGIAMGTLPIEVQRMMLKEMVHASIEVGDITGAVKEMHEFEAVGVPRALEPMLAVLNGRLAEGLGRVDDALQSFQAAGDSWDRRAAAQGRLREIVLKRSIGSLSQADAIAELETLTTVWRGDETELEALALLARLYTEEGRYRDAFHFMRTALAAHPNSEITRRIHDEAAETFDGLFLGGKADALPAIDALSLFYDFRDLTPIGRRGDEMIRRLADRLVAVDLLDQAAELLQHQVDHRLQGAARAQVATRLAMIYLMNRKPDRTLAALRATRVAELSNELRNQRLLLEARALSDTGPLRRRARNRRRDRGREQRCGCAPTFCGRRDAGAKRPSRSNSFMASAGAISSRSPPPSGSISCARRSATRLARTRSGSRASARSTPARWRRGPSARAFEVVTAPIGTSGAEFRDVAGAIAAVDTLDAFLRDMRTRYPESRPLSADQSPARPRQRCRRAANPNRPPPAPRHTERSDLRSVALHQAAGDQRPAVDQHEEDQLERQRHHDRRQHHHAHRHEHRCHHQVDDQERQEQQEADLEGALELRDHEGRDEDAQRHLLGRRRRRLARQIGEQRQILLAYVLLHEGLAAARTSARMPARR